MKELKVTPSSTMEIMNTDQPCSICIDGIEIPTYMTFWKSEVKREVLESKVKVLRLALVVQAFAIIFLGITVWILASLIG